MQEFQEEIAPIKDDVTHMNQLASTFGPHDIQLSPANLEHIDDLNTRWRLLQVHSNPKCLVFNDLLCKASYYNMKSMKQGSVVELQAHYNQGSLWCC